MIISLIDQGRLSRKILQNQARFMQKSCKIMYIVNESISSRYFECCVCIYLRYFVMFIYYAVIFFFWYFLLICLCM